MLSLNPYLNFKGNTEEAFNFYKTVFGGEFITLQRFKDTPESGRVPANEQDKIMHVSLAVSKGYILMGTDALDSMGHKIHTGDNISLSVIAESEDEATKLFNGLAHEGTIQMPLQKTFWGAFFGMLKDKFGIQWMVSYDYPKN